MEVSCRRNLHRQVLLFFLAPYLHEGCHAFCNPCQLISHYSCPLRRESCIQYQSRHTRTSSAIILRSDQSDSERGDDWEAGDVYKDLGLLETAINYSNAEPNLVHMERMEKLQHFAKQRRPLIPDIRKFVLTPVALASVLSALLQNQKTKIAAKTITACFDLHFWMAMIVSPLLLLLFKKMTAPPPEPMPEEMVDLAPEYLSFITTDWEDSDVSCKDHSLFLLEYWSSSVVGMAIVGLLGRLIKFPNHRVVWLWFSCAQLLTRLGAIASLHQYPKQLYELQRSKQPRPLSLFPAILQPLVRNVFLLAPFGVASDLAKILVHLQKESLVSLYVTISLLMFGTSLRMVDQDPLSFGKLKEKSSAGKLLYTAAISAIWRKPLRNLALDLRRFPFHSLAQQFRRVPFVVLFTGVASTSIGVAPIISPLIHLNAIRSILRVIYTHDLSLAMDERAFKANLDDESEQTKRMTWRYRLIWREPKRLGQLVNGWKENWAYWWLVEGGVTEQLARDVQEERRKDVMQDRTVWNRIEKDIAENRDYAFVGDRDQWKKDAMERIAKEHQKDYDSNAFDDPMGIAIQQTFGIGLGYNFEHTKKLEGNEKPSLRRLQARAAKSAIRRVQELYDPEGARKELEKISDPKKRDKRAKELRDNPEKEVKSIAKRLGDLVPTGLSKDFDKGTHIQQYRQKQFVKTSSHEYIMLDPIEDAAAVYKRPRSSAANKDTTSDSNDETADAEKDDEFVEAYEAYIKQQQQKKGSDDDDDTTTILA